MTKKIAVATQKDVVLKHLKQWGTINCLEAITQYRILRLAAVIHDLRNCGYDIKSVGLEGDRFVEYQMSKETN